METGKISENILKRSVLKQIHHRCSEVAYKAGSADDCAFVCMDENNFSVLTTNPTIVSGEKGFGRLAVYRAVNDVAAAGAKPVGILVSVLLPEAAENPEAALRLLMKEIEAVCEELDIEIMGGHTEVSAAVARTVLNVTGMGRRKELERFQVRGFRAGHELVMTGWAALAGTALIAETGQKELQTRLTMDYIDGAKEFLSECPVIKQAEVVREILGEDAETGLHNAANGGIFGALWEIASASGTGFSVDLRKIPLKQETVEICEFYDLNPYMLLSEGSLLIGTTQGTMLAEALNQTGIKAEVIGYLAEGKDKLIRNGEETRCLDMPKGDEWDRFIKSRENQKA